MRAKRIGLGAAALMTLAGCGAEPLPVAPQPSRCEPARPQPGRCGQAPSPPPPPGQGPLGPLMPTETPASDPEGLRLLQALRQQLAACRGIQAEVRFYSEGRFKNAQPVNELRKGTMRVEFTWGKPLKMRGRVIETTSPLMEGGSLVTVDGRNVTARARGLLSLIPIHMKADDGRLANLRAHRFSENNPPAHLQRLTAEGAVWKVVGQVRKHHVAYTLVAVDGVKRLDAEIDREILTIAPSTLAIGGLDGYIGSRRVVWNDFLTFRWNPRMDADTFKL